MKSGFEQTRLCDATAQEVMLELIRRRRFNLFDGPRIAADLLSVQDLWEAVLMDRPTQIFDQGRQLSGLIKLRDLPANHWNVDTMFICCESAAQAGQLMKIIEERDWKADDVELISDEEQVGDALGMFPAPQAIIQLWWD